MLAANHSCYLSENPTPSRNLKAARNDSPPLIDSLAKWMTVMKRDLTASGKDCRVREDRLKLLAEFFEDVRIG